MNRIKKALLLLCFGVLSCVKHNSPPPSDGRVPLCISAVAERTKTFVSGVVLPENYTIYASAYFTSYSAPESDGDYFVAIPFNRDGDIWKPDPVIYWPLGGKLDLIAIACEKNKLDIGKSAAWHEGNCSNGVEIQLEDGNCTDTEILFATAYGHTADRGSIPLNFKHAQSWLQFKVKCEKEILRIDRIVLENAYTGGLFRISNNVYADAEWIYRGHRRADITVPGSEGLIPPVNKVSVCNILVPEQDACNITVYYSVKNSPSDEWSASRNCVYRYTAGTNPWFYGEKNIYDIWFSFTEMTTLVSVEPWSGESFDIHVSRNENSI